MASGDLLGYFTPLEVTDATADHDEIIAVSGVRPCIAFDTVTNEWAIWTGFFPKAVNTTVKIRYAMSTSATGNTKWDVQWERCVDGDDLDAGGSDFTTAQTSGSDAAPTTANEEEEATVAFTTGAQMDSVGAGDRFRLKVTRDTAVASDHGGDARVLGISLIET